MFAKLLKHDLRAVFKYWWIGAVAVLGISVFGGFSMRIAEADTRYATVSEMGFFGILLSYIAIYLVPVFTQIVLLVRYYKHFFSDEGYLTFTLPVKKTSLFDSKLLTGFIYMLSSYALMFVSVCLLDFIYDPALFNIGTVWSDLSLNSVFDVISLFGDGLGGYTVPCVILTILAVVVYIFLFNAFIYACMTLASTISSKHKVLVGVSIYVGARVMIFVLTRTVLISSLFYEYNTETTEPLANSGAVLMAVLIGMVGIMLAVFGALYYLITVLLHKKLNLS